MQLELSDTIVKENSVGSFNNYVDKKGWVATDAGYVDIV